MAGWLAGNSGNSNYIYWDAVDIGTATIAETAGEILEIHDNVVAMYYGYYSASATRAGTISIKGSPRIGTAYEALPWGTLANITVTGSSVLSPTVVALTTIPRFVRVGWTRTAGSAAQKADFFFYFQTNDKDRDPITPGL